MTDRDRDMGTPQGAPNKTTMMTSIVTPSPPAPDLPRLSDQKLEKVPKFLKAAYRPKPNTSLCLEKDVPVVEGLCFKNMAEAQQSMAVAQWYAPQDDKTIPQTEEEDRKVTTMLVDAFKDMSIAKDTTTNAYRKRFTPGESVYYKDWAIEACAWDIVVSAKAKSIHMDGFKIPIYDKSIVDYIGQTQKWLFQERIDWICQVLRSSKHVAVTLMKHEKNWITIGAPHKLYSSTLVNTISNAHRGKWIRDGREADRNHQERPIKGKRTQYQMAISNGNGVGMDHVTYVDPGAAAGGEETRMQNQELAHKRQKAGHIVFDSEDVDMDDAVDVHSDAGTHPLKEPDEPCPDAEMIELMHGRLPEKSVAIFPGQDAGVDYHPAADIKGRSKSDNGSEPSGAPDGLLSDISSASPTNKKMDDLKDSLSTLDPRTHDVAHLNGARMLASLRTGR